MSRLSVFSKEGFYIGDIRASTKCVWTSARTGVVGTCDFDVSIYDSKAVRKYLNFGNYVLRRHPKLPDWVGIIYTPREWSRGVINIRAYQCEKVLDWRRTYGRIYSGDGGRIFAKIINGTNAEPYNEKPIFVNTTFRSGNVLEEQGGGTALKHIVSVAERTGEDFSVTHKFDASSGRIYLVGDWYDRRGISTSKWLREGYNMESNSNTLSEHGDIWNDYKVLADASTSKGRLKASYVNFGAIADYGLYQHDEVLSGVSDQKSLNTSVLSLLSSTIDPSKVLDITAIDVSDTFENLSIGNEWSVDINSAGFSQGSEFGYQSTLRITGMEHDDERENKCRLIMEQL